MVSSVYSSLNSLFAASFSDLSKTSALTNIRSNAVDNKRANQVQLPVDGINPDQQRQSQKSQNAYDSASDHNETLASFTKPKISLNPTDELDLFSLDLGNVDTDQQTRLSSAALNAIFNRAAPAEQQAQNATEQLASRKQSYVAQLYAQTNDIAFSSDKIVNQAA